MAEGREKGSTMTLLSIRRRGTALRSGVGLATLALVLGACASAPEPAAPTGPASSTSFAVPPPTTEGPASAPGDTTSSTAGEPEFSVASHGAGAVASLPGAAGMLGSGCTPGSESLPGGIWFGWIETVANDTVTFDLACLAPGPPLTATNANPLVRTIRLDDAVRLTDSSGELLSGWSEAMNPVWVFVNDGRVTEVAMVRTPVTVISDAGEWVVATIEFPVRCGCCGEMPNGPASPSDPWPSTGLPVDGVYPVSVTHDPTTGMLSFVIKRFVSCDDRSDLCLPDYLEGDLAVEPGDEIVRSVPLDAALTVRIKGITIGREGEIPGIEGSGALLGELLADMQEAWDTWVAPSLDGGGQIAGELMERGAADPAFPYGTSEAYGEGLGPLAYRGPHGVLFVEWLSSSTLFSGHTLLEVVGGRPVLYIDAGQIAG